MPPRRLPLEPPQCRRGGRSLDRIAVGRAAPDGTTESGKQAPGGSRTPRNRRRQSPPCRGTAATRPAHAAPLAGAVPRTGRPTAAEPPAPTGTPPGRPAGEPRHGRTCAAPVHEGQIPGRPIERRRVEDHPVRIRHTNRAQRPIDLVAQVAALPPRLGRRALGRIPEIKLAAARSAAAARTPYASTSFSHDRFGSRSVRPCSIRRSRSCCGYVRLGCRVLRAALPVAIASPTSLALACARQRPSRNRRPKYQLQ